MQSFQAAHQTGATAAIPSLPTCTLIPCPSPLRQKDLAAYVHPTPFSLRKLVTQQTCTPTPLSSSQEGYKHTCKYRHLFSSAQVSHTAYVQPGDRLLKLCDGGPVDFALWALVERDVKLEQDVGSHHGTCGADPLVVIAEGTAARELRVVLGRVLARL